MEGVANMTKKFPKVNSAGARGAKEVARQQLGQTVGIASATNPSIAILAKLGSIAVHADEATAPGGHPFDAEALRALATDPDVQAWLREFEKQYPSILPRKRSK